MATRTSQGYRVQMVLLEVTKGPVNDGSVTHKCLATGSSVSLKKKKIFLTVLSRRRPQLGTEGAELWISCKVPFAENSELTAVP